MNSGSITSLIVLSEGFEAANRNLKYMQLFPLGLIFIFYFLFFLYKVFFYLR